MSDQANPGLFERISEARRVLGLAESATMAQIEERTRALLMRWHPDACAEATPLCEEKTRAILEASRLVKSYCAGYRYSFSREEVEKYLSPEEWWFWRFGEDNKPDQG